MLIPQGRRLLLRINTKTAIDFKVGDGAVVYEGQPLVDKGALYVTSGFAMAYVKGSGSRPKPEILTSPSGRYFVTPEGLRSHLTKHPVIGMASSSGACCNGMALASFKVTVLADGSLVSVEPRNATDDVRRKVVPLLNGFKLRPFVINGAPIQADGILTILVDSSGQFYFAQ